MTSLKNGSTISAETNQRKVPYKRIKRAVEQIVTVALPLHLQLLREKSENIELLKSKKSLSGLRAEQIEAVRSLKLLKADLYELEELYTKVEDKDQDFFYDAIKDSIKEAVEAIAQFAELHPDADEPIPDINTDNKPEFPKLVCHLDQECEAPPEDNQSQPVTAYLTSSVEEFHASKSAFPDWSFLRKELLEVHCLITKFASFVFTQKEKVNTIQSNVEEAHENVQEGVHYLKKASLLKAATFPLVGAIAGGILLGPVGMAVGFKLVGTAACVASGGALGYRAGVTLKKKHEISSDIEMKALTYPSKEKSSSSPELSTMNYEQ
nr:syntaxin-17-like [Parasteatoda tepidariorum]XP_015905413.1 syntaxin-17-like [Parasteatoda tepidariorum]